ncbi:hypothetical protein WDZ92_35400, partial [Nostoc sp. NIES-2111]
EGENGKGVSGLDGKRNHKIEDTAAPPSEAEMKEIEAFDKDPFGQRDRESNDQGDGPLPEKDNNTAPSDEMDEVDRQMIDLNKLD